MLQTYSDGKMSYAELSRCLGLDEQNVKIIGNSLCDTQTAMNVEGGYALKSRMLEQIVQFIKLQCDGIIPTLELFYEGYKTSHCGVLMQHISTHVRLELEDVREMIREIFGDSRNSFNLDPSIILLNDESSGQPVEVANQKVLNLKKKQEEQYILSSLLGVTLPVQLDYLFSDYDGQTVQSTVQSLCNTKKLQGMLHHSTYTPNIYITLQRKAVDSFFSMNGFLTEKKCIGFGVAKNRVEQIVKESFVSTRMQLSFCSGSVSLHYFLQPNATALKSSIINAKQICLPLEEAIQSAVLNKSFTDLKSLISEELAACEEDMIMLMKNVLVHQLENGNDNLHDDYRKGVTIVRRDIALFFTAPMIDQAMKLLSPLIEDYAKRRAKEIAQQKKQVLDECIRLVEVAKCISDTFPDLLDIQQQYETNHIKGSTLEVEELMWSPPTAMNDGPLIEFCRHAFDIDTVRVKCHRAIKAESLALQHKVNASSMLEGATSTYNKEEAFESSFRDMCHLLQLFAKGIQTLEGKVQSSNTSDHALINDMKSELLLTCGSCIAKRITEYCMFKHAVTDDQKDALVFICKEAGLPHREHGFCIPVDIGTLAFPSISLECKPDEKGKVRAPLPYLKSLFPSSVGMNVVKVWSLCSGAEQNDGQHKLDAFIEHLNENCLSLVGIPFALLDKKNEKRLLATRRERISDLLQHATDKELVLLTSISFLFQLSKNSSIAGKSTMHLVLTVVLIGDKKIPKAIIETLVKLKGDDSDVLIDEVKKFGTAKNIKALSSMIT